VPAVGHPSTKGKKQACFYETIIKHGTLVKLLKHSDEK
jgi:hypothetical protein